MNNTPNGIDHCDWCHKDFPMDDLDSIDSLFACLNCQNKHGLPWAFEGEEWKN